MWKYIDNGYFTSGWRTYKRKQINNKRKFILVGWIQEQCIGCGKFLNKLEKRYCKDCVKKFNYKNQVEWRNRNREHVKEYARNYYRDNYSPCLLLES